jgi:predicted Zn-dependent peptidase
MWKFDITQLPSGLHVLSLPMPGVQSVSVGIWTSVGSRYEKKSLNGAAHFIEHLLFKGTKNRSAKQISSEIEGRGGYLNAVTSEESTCYYARARSSELPFLVEVLGDIYINAILDPTEVERERGVIREEILMYNEQPATVAHELLNLSLWPDDAVGRPVTGTLDTIQKITRTQLQDFRTKMYGAQNTWLVAAGNIDHTQLVACAHKTFANWQGAKKTPKLHHKPFKNPTHKTLHTEHDQVQIAVGFRGLHRTHADRFALRVLNVILGENMSSRLFQSLREERGWAYSVGSHIQLFHGTGSLIIQAGVDTKKWQPALDLILQECRRLATANISRKELARAHEYAIGNTWLGLESSSDVMFWIGECLVAFGKIIDPHHHRTTPRSHHCSGRSPRCIANLLREKPRHRRHRSRHHQPTPA